jgi:hypothetical protein
MRRNLAKAGLRIRAKEGDVRVKSNRSGLPSDLRRLRISAFQLSVFLKPRKFRKKILALLAIFHYELPRTR